MGQRSKRGLESKEEEEQRINVSGDNNAKSKIESCRFQKSHWAKEEKEDHRSAVAGRYMLIGRLLKKRRIGGTNCCKTNRRE